MKILIILHKAKKKGGLVLQLQKMSKIYRQKGHHVVIFSFDSINSNNLITKNLLIFRSLRNLNIQYKPDVIITSDPFITNSIALLTRNRKTPIVSRAGAVYHSFYAARITGFLSKENKYNSLFWFLEKILKFVAKLMYRNVNLIIFNSSFLKGIYSSGTPHSTVILNGVETRKLEKMTVNHPIKLVYVGRIEPRKSLELIIDALAVLKSKTTKFTLSIIGSTTINPDYWAKISQRITKLQLEKSIKTLGEIENHKLPNHLQKHDILLFSTDDRNFPITEGLPNVILEGMTNGLAIISTSVAGVPEIVGEENGFLIEPNSEIFAEKIFFLMNNEKKLLEMKNINILTVRKRNSIERTSNLYLKYIEELVTKLSTKK